MAKAKITYKNNYGQVVDLMTDAIRVKEANFHDFKWKTNGRNLQYGSRINSFAKDSVSYTVTFWIYGSVANRKAILNEFYDITTRDVENNTPGRLTWDKYYCNCYVTESTTSPTSNDSVTELEVIFFLPIPFWYMETSQHYNTLSSAEVNNINYDLPNDAPKDYMSPKDRLLSNNNYTACDFRISIYGPCENPVVQIAGHDYGVNAKVESGEYLVIDSLSKKIYLKTHDGEKVNCFNLRDRDSYIFQKIPVGTLEVGWSDNFTFDITLIESRSEPKWT